MADATETVERLDYSRLPPDYWVEQDAGDPPSDAWGAYLRPLWTHETEWESAWLAHREDALAAAWAHYKERHDPPGMAVHHISWWVDGYLEETGGDGESHAAARVAAWAWHDRRLALAERVEDARFEELGVSASASDEAARPLRAPSWPRCLTWSDAQVAEVERWLVDATAELPEVLHG